jgi:thiol-disulfide isomerase/thioredoxin
MKRPIGLIFFFLLFSILHAQEIKRIKITELATYISQSNHPLIINFWATFCGPCVRELPYFQTLTAKYKDAQVELLLVSLDLPNYYPSKIAAFAKEKHIQAPIAWLNETNADYFCPIMDKSWTGGIPSTLFVNNLTKFRRFYERQLTEPQLDENIKLMIKE